jgi:hypothetical protein
VGQDDSESPVPVILGRLGPWFVALNNDPNLSTGLPSVNCHCIVSLSASVYVELYTPFQWFCLDFPANHREIVGNLGTWTRQTLIGHAFKVVVTLRTI